MATATSADPDHMAPSGAHWSGSSMLFQCPFYWTPCIKRCIYMVLHITSSIKSFNLVARCGESILYFWTVQSQIRGLLYRSDIVRTCAVENFKRKSGISQKKITAKFVKISPNSKLVMVQSTVLELSIILFRAEMLTTRTGETVQGRVIFPVCYRFYTACGEVIGYIVDT